MGRRAGGWAGVSTTELFHSAPLRVGNPVKSACHSGEYAKTQTKTDAALLAHRLIAQWQARKRGTTSESLSLTTHSMPPSSEDR